MASVTSWVMVPVTPELTVKVAVLIDEAFIASLKVAVMTAREHTPVAPLAGGDGNYNRRRIASVRSCSETPYKVSGQPITKSVLHSGGKYGGVKGISSQRTRWGKDKSRVADIVSNGSDYTGCHGKSCAVDGRRTHCLAKSSGDSRKGTHSRSKVERSHGDYSRRRGTCVGRGGETPYETMR
jgi:hypothetical protein